MQELLSCAFTYKKSTSFHRDAKSRVRPQGNTPPPVTSATTSMHDTAVAAPLTCGAQSSAAWLGPQGVHGAEGRGCSPASNLSPSSSRQRSTKATHPPTQPKTNWESTQGEEEMVDE